MTMCGYLGNAAFSHAELVSASRSKNHGTLPGDAERCEDNVVRQRSTVLREDQNRIPKQVRDDNVRLSRKRRIQSC